MAKINLTRLPLGGAFQIGPFVSEDERGTFVKIAEEELLSGLGFGAKEVFYSTNRKNTLRGLHYLLPEPQARIVFCTRGKIWDAIVDLRKSSPSFGKWHGLELSEKNRLGVYVPKGFAHGFLSMQEDSTVLYFADEKHILGNDRGIVFDDPGIGIKWPLLGEKPIISGRDSGFPGMKDAELYD